jgi:hypothetical protein
MHIEIVFFFFDLYGFYFLFLPIALAGATSNMLSKSDESWVLVIQA